MFPTPLVARAFGVCVICQCRLKTLPILHTQKGWTLWKRKQGNWRLAWNTVYLPCAITVMCKRNIYIICNQFMVVIHVHVQYSVGHPLRPLCKGFHTPSPKRRSSPLTMINFTSHAEYHWLSGSLCTHKWTCCLLTWHFLEFSTVVVEQGSWISFKNAKAKGIKGSKWTVTIRENPKNCIGMRQWVER